MTKINKFVTPILVSEYLKYISEVTTCLNVDVAKGEKINFGEKTRFTIKLFVT